MLLKELLQEVDRRLLGLRLSLELLLKQGDVLVLRLLRQVKLDGLYPPRRLRNRQGDIVELLHRYLGLRGRHGHRNVGNVILLGLCLQTDNIQNVFPVAATAKRPFRLVEDAIQATFVAKANGELTRRASLESFREASSKNTQRAFSKDVI